MVYFRNIIFIIFISSTCFSEITGFVEYGQDIYSPVAYTEIEIGYIFRPYNFIFKPYCNINTWMEINTGSGSPFRDIYTFGADLKFDKITINASHFCSHYVESGWDKREYHRYYDSPLGGNLTKLSIRYDF